MVINNKARGNIDFKDVTLAYDDEGYGNDDAMGNMGTLDVTFAYDDDTNANIDSKDVTLASHNGAKG